jgi:hypothetical protein
MSAECLGAMLTSQPTRLLVLAAQLLGDVGLVLAKQFGVQADVAGSVDAVNVTGGPLALR